jgi:sarcosine oxidase
MAKIIDVIVLGLGANGSSALYHLSKTPQAVIGIDQFNPPHNRGSSHGQSRIIRQAYHENPLYVPFIKEAYKWWHQIEEASGKKLLLETGGIMLGDESSGVIQGSKLSAETHDIAYEYLDHSALRRRFPAFRPPGNTVGVLEKHAGILFPEACIRTYLEQAQQQGAEVRRNETVLSIDAKPGQIKVKTDKAIYMAGKLVVTAGAWLGELFPELNMPLTVERQILYWFKNNNPGKQRSLMPDELPVYIWEYGPGQMFYGFPDLGDGLKIAHHHAGMNIRPNQLHQDVNVKEIADMKRMVDTYFDMDATYNFSETCMYTNTPDGNFVIDVHPEHPHILIASPCSGHGFKFSSLTGKLLCDLATETALELDISPFRLDRFA